MNRNPWYYRFKADVNWLNDFVANIEDGFENLVIAMSQTSGIVTGFTVTERGFGQNFSVDVDSGWAYDIFGKRVYNAALTNVPFTDTYDGDPIECLGVGNERTVSVYAFYTLVDSDPVVDGNGDTVYTVQTESTEFRLYQGTTAPAGTSTPATNPNDGSVLLANVIIRTGDSTIANADIDNSVGDQFSTLIGTVGEAEILFGFGANEVGADDIPIQDTGAHYTATDVEAALAEVGDTFDSLPQFLLGPTFVIGDIMYASTTTNVARLADVAVGNALISGGVGAPPSWGKIDLTSHVTGTLPANKGGTDNAVYAIGDILYASGTTSISRLAAVTSGNALISAGANTAPSWGKIALASAVSGILPVANGGTGGNTSTGTGAVVLQNNATITTPSISTPTIAGCTMSGTWSGTATLSGTKTISGTLSSSGGTLSGSWAGNPTFSGNPNFSGSPTFTGELLLGDVDPPTAGGYINKHSGSGGWGHYYQGVALYDSYNVASITDVSTGQFTINWDTPFTTYYACVASNLIGYSQVAHTTGSSDVDSWNGSGVRQDTRNYFSAFGDQ